MNRISTIMLSSLLLAAPACDGGEKKEEATAATGATGAKAATATTGAQAASAATGSTGATGAKAATAATGAVAGATNSLEILASHAEPKPNDPVSVKVSGIKVVSSNFDPKNLEGATATFEIDVATLASGNGMRDEHLKGPDYLNVAEFTLAKVMVSEVKRSATGYTAKAEVDARGNKAQWELDFEVIESSDDSVRIKGSKTFDRKEFGIGKTVADKDSVADEVTANFDVTLTK